MYRYRSNAIILDEKRAIDVNAKNDTVVPKGAMATLVAIRDKLSRMQSEQHVQRIAIINEDNQVLATVGYGVGEAWPMLDTSQSFLSQQATPIGTAYGSVLVNLKGSAYGCSLIWITSRCLLPVIELPCRW